jgi:ABC-type dipeptide/oligopeptide/nickel transport system permease component
VARFLIGRTTYALVLLLLASVCIFVALRLAPGNPTDVTASVVRTQTFLNSLRKQYGLDKPLVTQYFIFAKRILRGSPGNSLISGVRITDILRTSGGNTLRLGLSALVLTYLFAIPLGVLAAWRRNKLIDQSARLIAVLGMGIPSFFLAVLLIQFFALNLRWLPVAGPGGFKHTLLPAIVLAFGTIAINLRLTRSAMLEELGKEYVTALRARGLSNWRIVAIHALRNALVPVIAFAGVIIPLIIGYTVIVEVVFRYEGLGYQLVQSIQNRDYPLAQTLALLFTALVIFSNLLADIAHHFVDPRIRERGLVGGTNA